MPAAQSKGQRWFPSKDQLKPERLEQTIRQILEQHYALQDQLDAVREQLAQRELNSAKAGKTSGPPPGSGPADSMLLGLRVAPVDTSTLADGAKLTWVKAAGNFQVK